MESREALRKVIAPRRELRRARNSGLGFLGGVALGIHHRLAVGRLEMQPALAFGDGGLDLVGPLDRSEQRLRLRDFGHFRRRRKPFERGREHVVDFEGAAGRLIEFASDSAARKVEATRALSLRDGDCSLERFLGGRGVGGVGVEQYFAAGPMQFGFECAMAQTIGRRQRFVEDGYGAVWIARPASVFARAIFTRPSKIRMFCARKLSTPRRMPSSPPSKSLSTLAHPSKNIPKARNWSRSRSSEFEQAPRNLRSPSWARRASLQIAPRACAREPPCCRA